MALRMRKVLARPWVGAVKHSEVLFSRNKANDFVLCLQHSHGDSRRKSKLDVVYTDRKV